MIPFGAWGVRFMANKNNIISYFILHTLLFTRSGLGALPITIGVWWVGGSDSSAANWQVSSNY